MKDKKNFGEKSNKLIKSMKEQNKVLNNYLEKLKREFHQKVDALEDTKENRSKNNNSDKTKKK